MVWQILFGEKATTKIAAFFDTEEQLNIMAGTLRTSAQLQPAQTRTVGPGERGFGRKLEPEGRGIARTALKSHIILGLAGLVVGFLAWLLIYLWGVAAIASSPGISAGVFLVYGVIAGMLLGGLITARPDHQLVIQRVRTASEEGRWSLIIHPTDPGQCEAVLRGLEDAGVESVRTV